MTLEVGKVYTFKFNSGEEVIAKVKGRKQNKQNKKAKKGN